MNIEQLKKDAVCTEVAQLRAETDRLAGTLIGFVSRHLLTFTPPAAAVAALQEDMKAAMEKFARACFTRHPPPERARRAAAAALSAMVLLPAARPILAELERELVGLVSRPATPERLALTELPRGDD